MNDPVWITGMGCVSAAGAGVEALWQATRNGRGCARELNLPWDARNQVKIGAALPPDWQPATLTEGERPLADLFSIMALDAATEAVAQAAIAPESLAGPRTGVILGSSVGGTRTTDQTSHRLYSEGARRLDPFVVPRTMANAASALLTIRFGATGPSFAVSSACASSAQAVGLGLMLLRSGVCDRMIVGGSESHLSPGYMKSWEALRVLSPDACRPFSQGRNGLVLGEAGAVLVLETAAAGRARGALPLAVLEGYGTTSDGRDMLRPHVDGCARAIREALADAGLPADAVGYVNAHGTGTVLNDATEIAALKSALGSAAASVPVSSTKAVHGHTLAAAGALELIITVCALRDQFVPPTANYLGRDPQCDLDVVPHEGRAARIEHAISNSFAFGGTNAVIVVGRADA